MAGDEDLAALAEGFGAVRVLDAGGLAGAPAAAAAAIVPDARAAVWPNPASAEAAVRFSLAAPSDVHLALYDVLGREVAAVDAGHLTAGTHRLPLDVSKLPAGVYVWRLSAGDRAEAGRLTVTR